MYIYEFKGIAVSSRNFSCLSQNTKSSQAWSTISYWKWLEWKLWFFERQCGFLERSLAPTLPLTSFATLGFIYGELKTFNNLAPTSFPMNIFNFSFLPYFQPSSLPLSHHTAFSLPYFAKQLIHPFLCRLRAFLSTLKEAIRTFSKTKWLLSWYKFYPWC